MDVMNREAMFYENYNGRIKCQLCPHECIIEEGKAGICRVRRAGRSKNGKLKLYAENYGEITSMAMDPIEKKPLLHFYPHRNILSIGSFGCNFKCSFCQNYAISQFKPETRFISPEGMAEMAFGLKDNLGIAFTYNEPMIWYEYVFDVSREIKIRNPGYKTVIVTNGYVNEEPLKELLPYIDAMNIDLKGGSEYYKNLCIGSVDEVKNTIMTAYGMGKHIEVTTLLVTGSNTDDGTLNDIGSFLSSIDKNIPIHISRYFPRYKMDKEATPLSDMKNAYKIMKGYAHNVHLGNLSLDEYRYCIS